MVFAVTCESIAMLYLGALNAMKAKSKMYEIWFHSQTLGFRLFSYS